MGKFKFFIFLFFLIGCISSNEDMTRLTETPYYMDVNSCEEVGIDEEGNVNPNSVRSTGDFIVNKVDVGFNKIQSAEILPSRFTLTFTVQSISGTTPNRPPLQGVPFQILTYQEVQGDGEGVRTHVIAGDSSQKKYLLKEVNSDNNGTITWQETYDYLTPGENQWIYFERVIQNDSGQVVIPFTINPWLTEGTKGYDLGYADPSFSEDLLVYVMPYEDNDVNSFSPKPLISDNSVRNCVERRSLSHIFKHLETKPKPLLHTQTVQKDLQFVTLRLDDEYQKYGFEKCECPNGSGSQVCIRKIKSSENENPLCEERGYLLDVDFEIPLKAKLLDSVGNIEDRNLERGNFKIKPVLMAVKDNERYPLYTFVTSQIQSLDSDGVLRSKFGFHIPYYVAGLSHIELWLEITDESQRLEPLVGVYKFLTSDMYDLQTSSSPLRWSESNIGRQRLAVALGGENTENDSPMSLIDDLDHFYSPEELREYFTGSKNPADLKNLHTRYEQELEGNTFISSEGGQQKSLNQLPFAVNASLPISEFQRMRFTRVVSDSGSNEDICESVVRRAVEYQGTVRFQDPASTENIASTEVDVKVEEYALATELRVRIDHLPEDQRENQKIAQEEDLKTPLLCKSMPSSEYEYVVPTQDQCQQFSVGRQFTRRDGILNYEYVLKHSVYDVQKFFPRRFIFEINGHAPESKFFVFNPWEYGFLTYQDYTHRYDEFSAGDPRSLVSALKSSENLPELRISEYRSFLIEPSYTLEDSLDINAKRNFMLSFRPFVVRKDAIGSTIRTPPRPLPVGPYILRVILLKGPQERNSSAPITSPSTQVEQYQTIRNLRQDRETALEKIRLSVANQQDHINGLPLEKARESMIENQSGIMETLNRFSQVTEEFPDYTTNLEAFRTMQSDCLPYNPNCLPAFHSDDYISHHDSVVYSDNGIVTAYVNLKYGIDNFRFLGSKASIVVQLLPTDPDEYEYESNQCLIDFENSEFKPFYDHDLIVQPHWGLVSLSDFAYSYALRPIDEQLLEPLVGNEDQPMKPLKDSFRKREILSDLEGSLKNIYNESDQLSTEYLQEELDDFKNQVSNLEELNSYCESDPVNDPEFQSRQECLCYFSTEENERIYPDDEQIQSCVALAYVERSMNYVHDMVSHFESEIGIEEDISERSLFCADSTGFAESYNSRTEDVSPQRDKFKNCVCHEERGSEELTFSMAECFAKQQGLKMVESSTLISDLDELKDQLLQDKESIFQYTESFKGWWAHLRDWVFPPAEDGESSFLYTDYNDFESENVEGILSLYEKTKQFPSELNLNQNDMDQIIQNGFNYTNNELVDPSEKTEPQEGQGSFLHLMCTFWFHKYYEDYFDMNQIKEMFQYHQQNEQLLKAQVVMSTVSNALIDLNESHREAIDNFIRDIQPYLINEKDLSAEDLVDPSVRQRLKEILRDHEEALAALDSLESFLNPLESIDLDSLKGEFPFNKKSISELPYFEMVPLPIGEQREFAFAAPQLASGGKQYLNCLKNPLYFFHFERKVMVGSLSSNQDDFDYKNGYVFDISIRESQEANIRRAWGTRLSWNNSSDIKVSSSLEKLSPISIGMDWRMGIGRGLTEDGGIQQAGSEGEVSFVNVAVNHIKTQMGFHTYKQCLVIRPRNKSLQEARFGSDFLNQLKPLLEGQDERIQSEVSSFIQFAYSQFGLLICGDEQSSEPLKVDEDYYYIHQFFGGHSEFMSRTIFQNRPFTEMIRGKSSFEKFLVTLGADSYKLFGQRPDNYNTLYTRGVEVSDRLINAFNDTKLDWAGFYKGVYTYPRLDHYYLTPSEQRRTESLRSKILEWGLERWFPAGPDGVRLPPSPSTGEN